MQGEVVYRFFSVNGNLRRTYSQRNLIVDTGHIYAARRFCGTSSQLDKIAIGTGSTPAATGDISLEAEVASDSSLYGPTQLPAPNNNEIYLNAIFDGSDWSGTINEAGLFSGITMYSRQVIATPQTLAADEVLQITWTVTF